MIAGTAIQGNARASLPERNRPQCSHAVTSQREQGEWRQYGKAHSSPGNLRKPDRNRQRHDREYKTGINDPLITMRVASDMIGEERNRCGVSAHDNGGSGKQRCSEPLGYHDAHFFPAVAATLRPVRGIIACIHLR